MLSNKVRTSQNPERLKRLICIFPHISINLKLFRHAATKNLNNIVVSAQLDCSGGKDKAIQHILDTIDKRIFDLVAHALPDDVPQIQEVILIVEGNGGNTGTGVSLVPELLEKLQGRCSYLSFAKNELDVISAAQNGKIPMLLYLLGTGGCGAQQSCDQMRIDWNAEFLNSAIFTVHKVINQYLISPSQQLKEGAHKSEVVSFPLSALSPQATALLSEQASIAVQDASPASTSFSASSPFASPSAAFVAPAAELQSTTPVPSSEARSNLTTSVNKLFTPSARWLPLQTVLSVAGNNKPHPTLHFKSEVKSNFSKKRGNADLQGETANEEERPVKKIPHAKK